MSLEEIETHLASLPVLHSIILISVLALLMSTTYYQPDTMVWVKPYTTGTAPELHSHCSMVSIGQHLLLAVLRCKNDMESLELSIYTPSKCYLSATYLLSLYSLHFLLSLLSLHSLSTPSHSHSTISSHCTLFLALLPPLTLLSPLSSDSSYSHTAVDSDWLAAEHATL